MRSNVSTVATDYVSIVVLNDDVVPTSRQHFVLTGTIDVLPEDVLLEIFDFYKLASSSPSWRWHRLIHVCRQWRSLVFASRHRLDLRLLCTYGTPVMKTLDCWPPLPIVIRYSDPMGLRPPSAEDDDDNIIAALQHRDRVCEVELAVGSSLFAKLTPLLQKPFPSLESLTLRPRNNVALTLPNAFLGTCTPRLRNLHLDAVAPPPALPLPTFLPSSRDLVCLRLQRVPGDAHIPPDALLVSLAAATQLKILCVQFAAPTTPGPPSYATTSDTPPSPPVRRVVTLPALSRFGFRGSSEFLEELVAGIRRAPSLLRTYVSLFDQPTSFFEIPHFAQFVARTVAQPVPPCEAKLVLHKDGVFLSLSRLKHGAGARTDGGEGEGKEGASSGATGAPGPRATEECLRLHVSCLQLGRQLPSMAQICRQLSPLSLSSMRKLEIVASVTPLSPHDVADASQWVGLFHVFGGVEELRVSYGSVPDVARALQRVARESAAAEVLPALRDLRFDWFASRWEEAVGSFITARQFSGHPPITFHRPKVALP
jgi:hypothetical protein